MTSKYVSYRLFLCIVLASVTLLFSRSESQAQVAALDITITKIDNSTLQISGPGASQWSTPQLIFPGYWNVNIQDNFLFNYALEWKAPGGSGFEGNVVRGFNTGMEVRLDICSSHSFSVLNGTTQFTSYDSGVPFPPHFAGNFNITFIDNSPAPDLDSDDDGVPDLQDNCPDTPAGAIVDVHGCPASTIFRDRTAFLAEVTSPTTLDFEVASGFPAAPASLNSFAGGAVTLSTDGGDAAAALRATSFSGFGQMLLSQSGGQSSGFLPLKMTFTTPRFAIGFHVQGLIDCEFGIINVTFASGAPSQKFIVRDADANSATAAFVGLISSDPIASIQVYAANGINNPPATRTSLYGRGSLIDNVILDGTTVTPTTPTVVCPAPTTLNCAPAAGLSVTVQANVTDPDAGETLTVTLKEGAVLLDTQTLSSPANNAQVTFNSVTLLPGAHTLTINVSDGSLSGSCNASATIVQDTTGPVISGVPGTLTASATSAAGAVVTFASPTANDACDGIVTVVCTPLSGSTFPVGNTVVNCTATDNHGNPTSANFTVTVTPQGSSATKVDGNSASVTYSGAVSDYPGSQWYNNTMRLINAVNSYAQFSFTGTTIKWIGMKQFNLGIASVYIDGVLAQSGIDTYAPGTVNGVELFSRTGLANTLHTIRVVETGQKNPANTTGARIPVDYFEYSGPPPPPTQATFVKKDATTKGSWKGTYGADGYNIINFAFKYPSYATATPSGKTDHIWASSTSDVRALQKSGTATTRIAAAWYSTSSFTVDLNLTDGNKHRVALYCVDWDTTARAETIQILNASNNSVLNSQSVTAFNGGQYLVWDIQGHVLIRLTKTGGANAVLSGIFFDQAP